MQVFNCLPIIDRSQDSEQELLLNSGTHFLLRHLQSYFKEMLINGRFGGKGNIDYWKDMAEYFVYHSVEIISQNTIGQLNWQICNQNYIKVIFMMMVWSYNSLIFGG